MVLQIVALERGFRGKQLFPENLQESQELEEPEEPEDQASS